MPLMKDLLRYTEARPTISTLSCSQYTLDLHYLDRKSFRVFPRRDEEIARLGRPRDAGGGPVLDRSGLLPPPDVDRLEASLKTRITPARKIRTLAHTSPTRQRGKSQGTLAGASGWYVGPAESESAPAARRRRAGGTVAGASDWSVTFFLARAIGVS